MKIRQPAVSGMFYNTDAIALRQQIEGFFSNVNNTKISENNNIHGIIVPHAGHMYSGQTAAYAYSLVPKDTKKIVMLGPCHNFYIRNAVLDDSYAWKTPLGEIKLGNVNDFADREYIILDSNPHMPEHSLEVQIPFLQLRCNESEIIPILVGEVNDEEVQKIARILLKNNGLFLISTDLSHFHNQEDAKKIDKNTLNMIQNLDTNAKIDACGLYPLLIAMYICKLQNWKIKLLHYSTSADTSGDYSRVVGYASLVF